MLFYIKSFGCWKKNRKMKSTFEPKILPLQWHVQMGEPDFSESRIKLKDHVELVHDSIVQPLEG